MIEQLWYTWSTVGLGGITGFRVRAASEGLTDIRGTRFQELDKYLRYELPKGYDPYIAQPESAPRCLMLLNTPNERIVVHKAYVGKDDYGRPGVFFCHLLANFPREIPASAIIELWRSDFWEVSDADKDPSTELPCVDLAGIESGKLEDYQLHFVSPYLPLVIYAFLSLKEGQKLYIAASSDDEVATLIWGLTRCLPLPLQRNLTFSTYETELKMSPALVIGACITAGQDLPRDFPSAYMSDAGFAVNCSAPPPDLPEEDSVASYARFASSCLTNGDLSHLIDTLDSAENSEIQAVDAFLSFTAVTIAIEEGRISRQDVMKVLSNQQLANIYLAYAEVQRVLLYEAINDSVWWQREPRRCLEELSANAQDPQFARTKEALAQLASTLVAKASEALTRAPFDTYLWHSCVNILSVVAPTRLNPAAWLQLLQRHYDYFALHQEKLHASSLLNWQSRFKLLQRVASIVPQLAVDTKLIAPWLPVQWNDELVPMLRLPALFPPDWKYEAIIAVLKRSYRDEIAYPSNIVPIVESYSALFDAAFQTLWSVEDMRSLVLFCFRRLGSGNYLKRKLFVCQLLQAPTIHAEEIEQLFLLVKLSAIQLKDVFRNTYLVLLTAPHLRYVQDAIKCYLQYQFSSQLSNVEEHDKYILTTLYEYKETFPDELVQEIADYYWLYVQIPNIKLLNDSDLKNYLTHIVKIMARRKLFQTPFMDEFYYILLDIANKDYQRLNLIISQIYPNIGGKQTELLYILASSMGSHFPQALIYESIKPFLLLAVAYTEKSPDDERRTYITLIIELLLSNASDQTIQQCQRNIPSEHPLIQDCYYQWYQNNNQGRGLTNKVVQWLKRKDDAVIDNASSKPSAETPEIFEKVMALKILYIPIRLDDITDTLNRIRQYRSDNSKSEGNLALHSEQETLRRCNDPGKAANAIKSVIHAHTLIQQDLSFIDVSSTQTYLLDSLAIQHVCEEFMQDTRFQEARKKLFKKNFKFTDRDVLEVLMIFVRLRFFAFHLEHQHKISLEHWYQKKIN